MEKRRNSELDQLEQLRSKLKQNGRTEKRWQSTKMLLRYLRFNGQSVERALKMIDVYHSTMEKVCKEYQGHFPIDLAYQVPFYLGGSDHEGRPIAMLPDLSLLNLSKYIERGETKMLMKYMMTLVKQFGHSILGRDACATTLVLNVENLQYSNYLHRKTIMFMLKMAKLGNKMSPGEVDHVIVLNAPRVGKIMYQTFKKIVPATMDVIFVDDFEQGVWKEEFSKYFSKEAVCPEFGGNLTTYDMSTEDIINFVAEQTKMADEQ